MLNKSEVFEFLTSYKECLLSNLKEQVVEDIVNEGVFKRAEDNFLTELAIPILSQHSIEYLQIDEKIIGESLRVESYKKYSLRYPSLTYPPLSSGARTEKHPFPKNLNYSYKDIYDCWLSQGKKNRKPTEQHWPDFGLQIPDKLNVVFEGKYYRDGGQNSKDSLVQGLYEALFYLGLPNSYDNNGEVKWSRYDYACFLAYDASDNGDLLKAYDELPNKVRQSLWDSASIFPIVIKV